MPRAIAPDLLDCLRRPNPYTEIRAEITAPDCGMVLRRPDLYGPAGSQLVAGSITPAGSIATSAQGSLAITSTGIAIAQSSGADTYYDLNTEDPQRRIKGLVWTLDPAFTASKARTFTAQIQRTGFGLLWAPAFNLQIYRVTRSPGLVTTPTANPAVYTTKPLTNFSFGEQLHPATQIPFSSITWNGYIATVSFDLSNANLILQHIPGESTDPTVPGELPRYYFVITISVQKATDVYRWLSGSGGAQTVAGIGSFQRSFWARNNANDPWVETLYPDTPAFALYIDSVGASAQGAYSLNMGKSPSSLATGRVVFERSLPKGTAATMEVSTNGGASFAQVQDGDIVAPQQNYEARITLHADQAQRSTPTVTAFGVEFRTPTDVSVESVVEWPTREVAPPWLTPSIPEGRVSVVRTGIRDYLDPATLLGSTQPTSRLEVDLFLASRHPAVARSEWLRLERLTFSDRVPTSVDEQYTCLSYASKLKRKVPGKIETVSTTHVVTASTVSLVTVNPPLTGTSSNGGDYTGKNYYMRVAQTTSSVLSANFEQLIAGNTNTTQLVFSPQLPSALNVGDLIEVHSGVYQTAPLSYADADPADVWWDVLTNQIGISVQRIGIGFLPRGGLPPKITDRAPNDPATQAKLKVSFNATSQEDGDALLDQLAFIMGGATIEISGQIVFVQIYPLRAPDGSVVLPLAQSVATFDPRDYTNLTFPPSLEQRSTVVTCDYGVNPLSPSQSNQPGSTTVVADNDAQAWLSEQDLDQVGSSAVPDDIKRWCYNSADGGLYLASQIATQPVRAASMGLMLPTLQLVERHPELLPGDVVTIVTDQFTAYDPTMQSAISGWTALRAVVVHATTMGDQLTLFIQGLTDSVTNISGGNPGTLFGLGEIVAPTKPTLSERISPSGVVDVFVDGSLTAYASQVVIRTDRPPTVAEILASPYTTGVGVENGVILSVATVPPHTKFWIGGISTNVLGVVGDPNIIDSEWLGVGATPMPVVSAGAPIVQQGAVIWQLTLSATCARVDLFRAYKAVDPSPGSNLGVDLESLAAELWNYFEVGENGIAAGIPFPVKVPLYNGGYWACLTCVPTDRLHVRGPSLNLKSQGAGQSPPAPPGVPTVATGTPTASTIPATATLPGSGGTIAYLRMYADGKVLGDVQTGAAPGGTQALVYGTFAPATPHQLQVSGVTSTGVEGPLSAPVTATTTGDTSGGGGGTGTNGKLPTPTITAWEYSRPDQAAILTYSLGYGTPAGVVIDVQSSSAQSGPFTDSGFTAYSSPARADLDQQLNTVDRYYRLVAQCSGYSDSNPSNVVIVVAPKGYSS